MSKRMKIGLIVFIVLGVIASGLSEMDFFKEGNKTMSQKSEEKVRIVDHEIVNKDSYPTGNAIRYSLDVVVDEKATEKELKALGEKIVEDMKKEEPFNAISIGFYDYGEFIGTGYTLGKIDYAPNGKWGDASTVSTGAYKKMKYTYSTQEKDWNNQLTQQEAEIYKAWKDLYQEKSTPENLPEEDLVTAEISNIFDIDSQEVKDIIMKQASWAFEDKNSQ